MITNCNCALSYSKECKMMKEFKFEAVRTLTSPVDKEKDDDGNKVKYYIVWVNLRDLPEGMPTDVNPREVNMKTATAKKLKAAVSNSDPYFDMHNRGMVILANHVKTDPSKSTIEIDFGDDPSLYGVLDGGHTYKAIIENRKEIPEGMDKFVKIEIFVGKNIDVAKLSDARNTSVQVSDIALFNLENKFEFIKEALESKNETYRNEIAYKDNEDKRIPISDLLRLMYAFNIDLFKDDTNAPIASYSGKAIVFKNYSEEYNKYNSSNPDDANDHKEKNIYYLLAQELPVLVRLFELIQKDMGQKYKGYKIDNNQKSAFGKIRGVKATDKAKTSYHCESIKYDIPSGYIMPIFGAFRALLKRTKDGYLKWIFKPEEIWERVGKTLVQNTLDTDTNPNNIGKLKIVWQSNYRIVENEKNKMLIAEFESKNR